MTSTRPRPLGLLIAGIAFSTLLLAGCGGSPPAESASPDAGAHADAANGASCSPSGCGVTLLTTDPAYALALDDTNVYFVGSASVSGVQKSGGQPFVVSPFGAADAGPFSAGPLTLDQGTLYWSTLSPGSYLPAVASLESAPTSARGGSPIELWTSSTSNFLVGLGVAGGSLYAVDGCDRISSVPISGAAQTTPIYGTTPAGCPSSGLEEVGFALDAVNGYAYVLSGAFTSPEAMNVVYRVQLSSGSATSFEVGNTVTIALAGGMLYDLVVTENLQAALFASQLDGTGQVAVVQNLPQLSTDVPRGNKLVVDATHAYYLSVSDASASPADAVVTLIAANLQTGAYTVAFTSGAGAAPSDLAQDDTYVYLALGAEGIVRVAK